MARAPPSQPRTQRSSLVSDTAAPLSPRMYARPPMLPSGWGHTGLRRLESVESLFHFLFLNERSLRGSVSCGSGWSVPCVSIQLTLSQRASKGGSAPSARIR